MFLPIKQDSSTPSVLFLKEKILVFFIEFVQSVSNFWHLF